MTLRGIWTPDILACVSRTNNCMTKFVRMRKARRCSFDQEATSFPVAPCILRYGRSFFWMCYNREALAMLSDRFSASTRSLLACVVVFSKVSFSPLRMMMAWISSVFSISALSIGFRGIQSTLRLKLTCTMNASISYSRGTFSFPSPS